jgi:hypothetical protein
MNFAKRLYLFAGIYGLVAILPQYFLEELTGRLNPPALTHPEYYYGFLGVGLAWQIAFLLIARDPTRYRMMMIPGIAEKVLFGVAVITLFLAGRVGGAMLAAGVIDLTWAALFIVAFRRTSRAH